MLAVVVGLAGSGLVGWRVARTSQQRRLMHEAHVEGMAAYREGDYESALSRLSYYLSRNKTDVEALLAFAECRVQVPDANNRHLTEAISLYQAALKLDPGNEESLRRLLHLYSRTSRRPEGMAIAERILRIDPDDVEALQAKSAGLLQDGNFEEALVSTGTLIENEPENLTWREIYLEIRRADNAPGDELIALCDEWIGGYDGDGRFHLLKAALLLSLGLTEEARAEAMLGAKQGADSADTLGRAVDLLDELDLGKVADQVIEKARASFSERAAIAKIVVRRLWQINRLREARAELAALDPADVDVDLIRWKAALLVADNDNEEALAALAELAEAVRRADPRLRSSVLAWVKAVGAYCDLRGSGWLEAVEACKKGIALNLQDPLLPYLLGGEYASVYEHELAVDMFGRAIKLNRHWVMPRLALARSLLETGRAREALDASVRLLRLWPGAPVDPYIVLAKAWMTADPRLRAGGLVETETGDTVDLISLLESLYDRSGGHLRLGALLVDAYAGSGETEAAAGLIERIMAQPGSDAPTLLALAEVSDRRDLGLESVLVARAEQLAGLTPDVVAARAELLAREGRVEEGLKLIDGAFPHGRGADPGPVAWRLRAAYLAKVDHPGAIAALDDLLAAEPASVEAATLVLSQPIAWTDRELISRAIDQLEGVVGQETARASLARAGFALAFESRDPARVADATARVGEILNRTPDSLAALTLMSRLLLGGDVPVPDQAIKYLRRAVDRYPDKVMLYPQLIGLLQERGNFEVADQYLKRFHERLDLPEDLRSQEVGLLTVQGDFDTAVARLAVMVDESSPEAAQLALASLNLRAGDHEAARAIYERLLAAPAPSEAVVEAAVGLYADLGQSDKALALLNSPGAGLTPASRAMLLGRFHEKHGSLDEAGRWLGRAVGAAPEDPRTWNSLVMHWLALNNIERATAVAREGLKSHPGSTTLRTALAVAEVNAGRPLSGDAVDLLGSLAANDAAVRETIALHQRAVNSAGVLTPNKRDLDEARWLLRDYPQFLPAWRLAVLLFAASGDPEEAIRLARRAANRFPSIAEPAQWAAGLLVKNGRADEALDMALSWRQRSLQDPLPSDVFIASLHLDGHKPRAAFERLSLYAARIENERDRYPGRFAVWLRALLLDRRFDRAVALAGPLIRDDVQWRGVWLAAAATGDPEVTIQALEYVERSIPLDPEASLNLAYQWLDLARRTAGDEHFERAEALAAAAGEDDRLALASLYLRASIATARNDLPTARAMYRAVLERNPDDPLALNNLAYTLVRLPGHCDEAIEVSARGLALAPDNADLLDTHARALACSGSPAAAESAARRACAIRGDDPEMLLTLVSVLLDQSKLEEADSELGRAEALLRKARPAPGAASKEAAALRVRLEHLQPPPVADSEATSLQQDAAAENPPATR